LDIKNESDFETAISFVALGKQYDLKFDATIGEAKVKAYAAYKEVNDLYKKVTGGVKNATEDCLAKMKAYLEDRKTKPEDDRLSYRTTHGAEVTDLKELCVAIAEGKAPVDLVKPNASAINKLGRSMKDLLNIGGLKHKESTVLLFKSEVE